ncbi:hypothetical protein FNV43_RR01207 [Rhamnella rubrinervis]|uniref:Uncharacterized protein n=1 Tax=Rhamnella rubrinervis TaxID=2594499 RepID=A0A8K0HS55_9ROSA|nr:hypothetical protein FNV43_RR01207 [Rhamnella rubrinervis]
MKSVSQTRDWLVRPESCEAAYYEKNQIAWEKVACILEVISISTTEDSCFTNKFIKITIAFLGYRLGRKVELTEKEISRAYKAKALELHRTRGRTIRMPIPTSKSSNRPYDILKDEKARKLFDYLLKVKKEQLRGQSERDAKRRKRWSLTSRERAALVQKLERRKGENCKES